MENAEISVCALKRLFKAGVKILADLRMMEARLYTNFRCFRHRYLVHATGYDNHSYEASCLISSQETLNSELHLEHVASHEDIHMKKTNDKFIM